MVGVRPFVFREFVANQFSVKIGCTGFGNLQPALRAVGTVKYEVWGIEARRVYNREWVIEQVSVGKGEQISTQNPFLRVDRFTTFDMTRHDSPRREVTYVGSVEKLDREAFARLLHHPSLPAHTSVSLRLLVARIKEAAASR